MTIVLFILKIIGIAILVLLGILLLVLAAVLFVPFRYQILANMGEAKQDDRQSDEAAKPQISVIARVHWLLHFLGVEVSFLDGQPDAYLRILLWRKKLLNDEEVKEDDAEVKKDAKTAAKDAAEEAVKPPEDAETSPQEGFATDVKSKGAENNSSTITSAKATGRNSSADASAEVQDLKKDANPENSKKTDNKKSSEKNSKEENKDKEEEPDGIFSRIRKLWNDFSNFRKKITRMVEDERNRRAVAHLKAELIRILKAIRPRKLSIDLEFSLGSPDLTGEVLGVCAWFPIFYQKENRLIPDFEADEAYAKGHVDAKGRIYLFQILFAGLRILFDKDCKRMYRMYKKYFG